MNKKGQELSIRTLIILILAVLVLIVLVLILSGVAGDAISKFKDIIQDLVAREVDV